MPTVPRRPDGLPTVPTAPLPTVRANPNAPASAFGVPSGVDLSGVADVARSIYEDQRAKADQVAVVDADRQLNDAMQSILRDPTTGYLNQRGANAVGPAYDAARTAWQQRVDQIQGNLRGDRQILAFKRMAADRQAQFDQDTTTHLVAETRAHDDAVTDSWIQTERNAAIANANDPDRVELSIARQQASLGAYAQRNGLPKAWITDRQANAASKTRLGVVQQLVDSGQDLAGAQYFAQHRDSLQGEDLLQAERLVESGSLRGASQQKSDAILATATSADAAFAAVQQISDPRLRDATEERVRRGLEERAFDDREKRAQAFQRTANTVKTTGSVDKVARSDWNLISAEEASSLYHLEEDIHRPQRRASDVGTLTWLNNLTALSEDSRAMFRGLDLTAYRDKLSDQDYGRFVTRQTQERLRVLNAQESDARSAARADARQAQKDSAAIALGKRLGIDLSGTATSPNAPTGAPTGPAPGAPLRTPPTASAAPADTLARAIRYAQHDPQYRAYLEQMGVHVPPSGPTP